MKFGGTSMADEKTWRRVLNLIQGQERVVVVVSATARTTRRLRLAADLAWRGEMAEAQNIANEIAERHHTLIQNFTDHHADQDGEARRIREVCAQRIDDEINQLETFLTELSTRSQTEISEWEMDRISSVGERISSFLLAQCAPLMDVDAVYVDAGEVMITDARFGKAQPQLSTIAQRARILSDHIKLGRVPVMGGYYGKNAQGEITTLGLEGSDYTASVIGHALHASSIQIWTDVSGVYSTDPRTVNKAHPIPYLTYDQASEMAALGAKVLHPQTLAPARSRNIPVQVKNMFAPQEQGTHIHHDADNQRPVTAIAYKEDNVLLKAQAETPKRRSKVLAVLDRFNLVPDLAVCEQSTMSLSMDLDESIQQRFIEEMQAEVPTEVTLHHGQIALIGCSPKWESLILQQAFKQLEGVPLYLIGRGQQRETLIITLPGEHTLDAVIRLHDELCSAQGNWLEYQLDKQSN
jgi:aspartate kinase